MNNNTFFDIPIVLFVFRRLDTVKLILEEIKKVRPATFYIFSDGARDNNKIESQKVAEIRKYIKEFVDWECNIHFEFAEKNKGCASNICTGLDKVFSKEHYAIIFEDDAVPKQEFFYYCQYLLKKYEPEHLIQYIAGFNAVGDFETLSESYTFSKFAPMSGAIATWADRWNECDFQMKNWPANKANKIFRKYYFFDELYHIHCKGFEDSYNNINDGWDYQFLHDMLEKKRFAIVPKGNLARSYGYTEGAFHPQNKLEAANLKKIMDYTKQSFTFPMQEPTKITLNREYDQLRQRLLLGVRGNYLQRHIYYAYRHLKDFAYKYMPTPIWNWIKKIVS